jgi:hypothetical protein
VLTDTAALAARTQATVTYQIATALQLTFGSLLDPAYKLVCVVLMCMYTEFAARVFRADVSIAMRVLPMQLCLSLMGAVDYALVQAAATQQASFLFRTYSHWLPSVLGSASLMMLSNNYVQNAISSYVYRYAQKILRDAAGDRFWSAAVVRVCVVYSHGKALSSCANTAQQHLYICFPGLEIASGGRAYLLYLGQQCGSSEARPNRAIAWTRSCC